jgi:hypothetical protein
MFPRGRFATHIGIPAQMLANQPEGRDRRNHREKCAYNPADLSVHLISLQSLRTERNSYIMGLEHKISVLEESRSIE